jgi:hypothetical protein
LNILQFIITFYYSGFSGDKEIPPWACFLCSFLYFAYGV